jgi:tripartite-type tricarboxylate transporter receptor subunit TctC
MALTDLLGGQYQLLFATVGSSIQYIKAGKVRPLAVATTARIDLLPDLPPLADFLPGYEASSWNGLTAPKNTPADIVDKLNREINAAMADPKIKVKITELGGPPIFGSPAEFGKIIAEDTAKWARVIQFSGAKAE